MRSTGRPGSRARRAASPAPARGIMLTAMKPLFLLCLIGIMSPHLYAADVSTFSFNSGMNCNGVWELPDTGQTQCYDGVTNTPGSCSTTTPVGQDGFYAPAAVQPHYTVNPDNTVTDNVTGLMWRRCSQGKTDDATCSGTALTYTWENAILQCEQETADHADWRLPNARELMSILHYGAAAAPRINTSTFPGTVAGMYWTSTTYMPTPAQALYVNFNVGSSLAADRTTLYYVRCVRGVP